MGQVTYQTILKIIGDINSFAEQSDKKIAQLWSNYNNSKAHLEEQYKKFIAQAIEEYNVVTGGIRKKALALKESAEKIHQDVLTLDATLANVDKYYVKTRTEKNEELAQKTKLSVDDEPDVFVALEKVKERYQAISSKYSKETLPAIIDGINYIFSKQRKQDYEELIILKNTIEKLMTEIKKTIPELISDSSQTHSVEYDEKIATINSKYQAEIAKVDARYEQNVESLTDEICGQLDAILPDGLLQALKILNESCKNSFTGITTSYSAWSKEIVLGSIDYPLELFVSSNILFSLIADKCSPILVQKKLLRFPFVCSLSGKFNMFIKYTQGDIKNQYVNSLIQSFLSSVPVTHLSLSVIDSASKGKNIAHYAELYKKLPRVFDNEIITAKEAVEERLEKLTAYIDECQRYKLCGSYNNIFEYVKDNQSDVPKIKLLLVFDTPQTLGDKNIALINNIIQNGGACGVYAVIAVLGESNQAASVLQPFYDKGCISIQQSVDMFMYFGLRVVYPPPLEGKDMSRFINKYLLSFDSVCGDVTMLDSDVCKLVVSDNSDTTPKVIASAKRTLDQYNSSFGSVTLGDNDFPAGIPVGTLAMPMDLVSDSRVLSQLKAELARPNANMIDLPAVFSLTEKNNLIITSPEVSRQHTDKFVHSLMWSFLSFVPVSKVNFIVFDAEQRGNSITPFSDFRQKLQDIFDGQFLYTAQDAMIARLQKMNSYIDDFIQEKLGNRFENIIEYNSKNPNRAEAITMLIVFDFPRNFDSRSIELLLDIMSNGWKCGIYTVICHNHNIKFSKYENIDEHIADIKKHCSIIDYIDKEYILWPYELAIHIAPELPQTKMDSFIKHYIEVTEALKRKGLAFKDAVRPPFFSASSAKSLSIPVGIGEEDEVTKLVLGEGSSHHGIIAGATGSGKSTLLHTIIMSGMLCHTPDELLLYLMDFKSGTEFKIYDSVKLPHIRLLALDAVQEFGESILENLVDEMLRRGDLFKNAGQTNLAGYVSSTGKSLPRILVIMDEFQVLFNDSANRKVAINCAELTKRIVTEGRAFGIHLLMATQSTKVISDLTLSHAIIEQMRVRIGLKCGEDDARYLFSDRSDAKALEMMKGPIGTAVMNLEYMESNNIGFRAAYCSKEAQEQYLSQIAEEFADRQSTTEIFEGNRTVMLVDHMLQSQVSLSAESVVKIHMGTRIKVAPPFVMQFDRRRRHNLLICGANERMAENLTNLLMVSALLNTDTDVICIDGESLMGENVSASIYGCLAEFTPRFKEAKNRAEIVQFVNDLYHVYSDRKKNGELKQTFVVIKNMQFLDIVKKMFKGESVNESEFGSQSSSSGDSGFDFGVSEDYSHSSLSVTEKMLQLIDDGSSYGVFFVVSSLEYQSVKENMYYGENILAKFPERIVFVLSNNDADNLIDGIAVSGLRDNTVYFTDGIKATFQYKPYVMPNVAELKNFLDGFQAGGDIS